MERGRLEKVRSAPRTLGSYQPVTSSSKKRMLSQDVYDKREEKKRKFSGTVFDFSAALSDEGLDRQENEEEEEQVII
jgi:hypothetical protein